jgi:ATP-binding cassette, subfamily B, bacterial PglK
LSRHTSPPTAGSTVAQAGEHIGEQPLREQPIALAMQQPVDRCAIQADRRPREVGWCVAVTALKLALAVGPARWSARSDEASEVVSEAAPRCRSPPRSDGFPAESEDVPVLRAIKQAIDLIGREHRRRWALLIILALIVSLVEMVGAVLVYVLLALVAGPSGDVELPVVGDVRARFPGATDEGFLLGVVLVMAAFFVGRAVLRVAASYVQARIAHNAGARLSTRLVDGYLRWPYEQHLRRHSALLIRNGHHAVMEMIGSVLLPAIKVAAESVLLIGMLTLLAAIAPLATVLAVTVVGGAALLLLLIVQPRLKVLGRVSHQEAGTTLEIFQQSLHGLRDIKVLGRESFFSSAYSASRRRMARAQYLHDTAWQLPTILIETALLSFILMYFSLAVLRGDDAADSLSVLGLFAYAGLRLLPSLQHIVSGLNNLKYAAAPLEDIHADLIAIRKQAGSLVQPKPLPFTERITVNDLTFRYGGASTSALNDVALTVDKGEQIGICGPTGGGKTTLVDLLAGLLQPSGGRILIDGIDLRGNERAWQQNLGIVPQMVFLIDDTLRRNIALGVADEAIDEAALAEAVRLAQLYEFVEQLPEGLDTTVGERGIRVSGGQRQRIAIARALYRRPSVLVFDEGTSALDNATEAHLMDAIEGLRGSHTILLVAHRLSTVQNSDRVVFLSNGRVEAIGPYEELFAEHPGFRKLAAR